MGRLKRLALWGAAGLMAVTSVAVGEPDPAWATSPTDEAGVSGAVAGGARPAGLSAGSGARAASGQSCSSGQTYLSQYGGCRPTTCANGRRSNGTCRACADPTHMRRDGACRPKLVPAATDPSCPAGQLYYSSYRGCRPSSCANGRTSTGYCRPACLAGQSYFSSYGGCRPSSCANGRTSTGYCRPACSAGQSYFSSYGGCRPTTCANGRTSTGTCRTCPAGQTYLSAYSGCRPTTCANGRRSNGTCRSCADPTHMRRDGACLPKLVPAATDPPCPTGQLYYSSYGGCRPTTCANGRTSTGTCQPACTAGQTYFSAYGGCRPTNCANGRTSTGTCRVCPAGQTQRPAFGTACVPANCTYGYTGTGTCEAASPNHRYPALKCSTYSADATALEYLDIDDKLDQATCPPQGLFLASPKVEDWPTWGFQKTVAKYYGKIVVNELSECSWFIDTGPTHDFQIPCKAHDYCFDLRRAGLSGTVLDDDCDDVANSLMIADCKDRPLLAKLGCHGTKAQVNWALATAFSYTGPSPGAVNIVNIKTGKCVSVVNSSLADGAGIVQSSCVNGENQQFLLHPLAGNRPYPKSGSPGYFRIKPVHSSSQDMCVTVVVSSLKQKRCSSTSSSSSINHSFGLDSVSGDTWTIKRKYLNSPCWTVPYTDSSGKAIVPTDGTGLVNVLCTPASRSNQVWRIQEPESLVVSTPTTVPPATTAPPTTTAPPAAVPAALSGLTATASADAVVLSWNDPGDGSITRYQVRERPGFDGIWWCWSGFGASPSGGKITYRVQNLPSGAAYKFQARAQNAAGFGPAVEVSASTSAATSPPASVPAAPSGFSSAPGDRSVTLSWNNPGDSSIIRYQLRGRTRFDSGWGCWRHIYDSTASTVSHTLSGITNGHRFRSQIRALNAAGASAVSETSSTPTASPARPGP